MYNVTVMTHPPTRLRCILMKNMSSTNSGLRPTYLNDKIHALWLIIEVLKYPKLLGFCPYVLQEVIKSLYCIEELRH